MAPLDPTAVRSREDLAQFLNELALRARRERISIENVDAASFINAAAGWVGDLPGFFANRDERMPDPPSWSLIASIFMAATVYE